MQIRPAPPFDFTDARSNQIGQQTNNNRIVSGPGISISKGNGGTTISVNNACDPDRMVHQGEYDYNESYNPGDVVYVNPNYSFVDITGSNRKPAAGSWICQQFVPCIGQDSSSLISNVWPLMVNNGMSVTPNIANSFRHSFLNDYFPSTASATTTWQAECDWEVSKGNSYWTQVGGGTADTSSTNGLKYYAIARLFATSSWSNEVGWYGAIPIEISYATASNPSLWFLTGSATDVICPLKFIAKPMRQRYVAQEIIEGVTVSYTNYTDNDRTCGDGTGSHTELQVCFPRYQTPAQCGYTVTTASWGMPTSSLTGSAVFEFLSSQCVVAAIPVDATGEIIYEKFPSPVFAVYSRSVSTAYPTGSAGTWSCYGPVLLQEVLPHRVWARRFLQ